MQKYFFILSSQFFSFFCSAQHFSKSAWISTSYPEDSVLRNCPVFQKKFSVNKPVKSAVLFITAHGLYEVSLNDKRIGHAYFTPGWTSYPKLLQYQSYEITAMLNRSNEIRVTVGEGWWRGTFGGSMENNHYGKDASLLLEIKINYADGTKQSIVSDSSWKVSKSSILYSGIYEGEMFDNSKKNYDWQPVKINEFSKNNLIAESSEPVTKQERFRPVKIKNNIVDFGQNIAGWIQLKVNGRAGDTIKVFHAETLDKDGKFFIGNLREAKAEDIYILKNGWQVLEPHFTYHGFRYIKVSGFKPAKNNCTAIALHTNLKHTGTFVCSDPMLNQLQHNIEWSLNANFFDVPTDCPQRSERLGWTGDAQVFCRTACFNRYTLHFFRKWLADLSAEQNENGALPVTVPRLDRPNDYGVAGWGDAATIIPWTLFEIYADTALLLRQYSSMKAWVDYIRSVSPDLLFKNKGYGDWYSPGPKTPLPIIDQCFFAHSTALLIQAAHVLNQQHDIDFYSDLLNKIKSKFNEVYKDSLNTQTACVLALQFDMAQNKKPVMDKLVQLIHQNNDHLATGFLGTPYLLSVLSDNGYIDLAYKILSQKTIPSWLYPVSKGATTIWEKWDAIKPDGTFDTCSLNHYAYGAVGDWLYENVAGIQSAAPGYKKIIIHPLINKNANISWTKSSYICSYGKIVSDWKIKNNNVYMHVEIPNGTTAIIYCPGKKSRHVPAGIYNLNSSL